MLWGPSDIPLEWRYWLELSSAAITAVICVVTLFWHDWIEAVFGIDPDHGSGWLEWLIVGVLAIAAFAFSALARAARRRLRGATSG